MTSRSILARYVLVAFVSALVATALAATGATAHNDGFSERIVACFDSRDPDSEQCRAALEVSPVDAGFFMRLSENLNNPQPKPEPKPDLYSLVKACAVTKDLESDECARALDATGLSLEDFKAKFAAKLGCLSRDEEEPCQKPEEKYGEKYGKSEWNGEMTSTMKDCLAIKAAISGLSAEELMAKAEKLNAICAKAVYESKMSAGEFWSKYH